MSSPDVNAESQEDIIKILKEAASEQQQSETPSLKVNGVEVANGVNGNGVEHNGEDAHSKNHQDDASLTPHHGEAVATLQVEEVSVDHHQEEATPVHQDEEVSANHHQEEATPVLQVEEVSVDHHQEEATPVHQDKDVSVDHHQEEAAPVHQDEEVSANPHQEEATTVLQVEEVSTPLQHDEVVATLKKEDSVTVRTSSAPKDAHGQENDSGEVIPRGAVRDTTWSAKRQSSQEMKREVEAQSRPTLSKAAMSTSIDERSVREAYEDVRSDTSETEWAVYKFQNQNIVCSAMGVGFDTFRGHFADDERAFGFIRIQMGDEMSKRQKFVFLTWVGPRVSVIRRAKMSIDKAMVKNIVKNFAVELQVETLTEINLEYFREQLARVGGANYGTGIRD